MSGNDQNQVQVPIRRILGYAIQYWYLFLISFIITFGLAYLQIKKTQPSYRVEASLLLEDESMGAMTRPDLMKEMNYFSQTAGIDEQIGLITSYSLLEKAVEQINVGKSYYIKNPFNRSTNDRYFPYIIEVDSTKPQLVDIKLEIVKKGDGGFLIKGEADKAMLYDVKTQEIITNLEDVDLEVSGTIGKAFQHELLSATIKLNPDVEAKEGEQYFFSLRSIRDLTEEFKKDLVVEPIEEESKIVSLKHTGVLIEESKQFLDVLMNVYISDAINKKSTKGKNTIAFIDEQINYASDSLKQVENVLENFQERSQVIDVEATARLMVDQRAKLEDLLSDRKLVADNYKRIQNSLNVITSGSDVIAPAGLERQDPVLSGLLLKLSELKQEKAKAQITAVDNAPHMQLIEAQINSQIASIKGHIDNNLSIANNAVQDIRIRIGRLDKQIYSLPGKQKELASIERDFNFSDEQHKYLVQKRAEASIALAGNKSETYVIDKARLTSQDPVSPNKSAIFVFAFIIGLSLPLTGLIGYQILNDKITSREDLELSTNIPILGIIIKSDLWNKVVSKQTSSTRLAESFRSARIQLQYLLSKDENAENKVIGVTSSSPNEGKSFCAANFASTLALNGKKTLLMDLDLRKPDQKEYFTYDNSIGLHGYLTGRHRYTDILTKIENIGDLWLFPSGPVAHNSLDLLDSKKFKKLIENLRKRFDHIILDTPPIGHTSDYYIIKDMVDFTVYVVRHNLTSSQALGRVNQLDEDQTFGRMGILINGVKDVQGYNYGEGASYGYGKNSYGYSSQHQDSKPQNLKEKIMASLKK